MVLIAGNRILIILCWQNFCQNIAFHYPPPVCLFILPAPRRWIISNVTWMIPITTGEVSVDMCLCMCLCEVPRVTIFDPDTPAVTPSVCFYHIIAFLIIVAITVPTPPLENLRIQILRNVSLTLSIWIKVMQPDGHGIIRAPWIQPPSVRGTSFNEPLAGMITSPATKLAS